MLISDDLHVFFFLLLYLCLSLSDILVSPYILLFFVFRYDILWGAALESLVGGEEMTKSSTPLFGKHYSGTDLLDMKRWEYDGC